MNARRDFLRRVTALALAAAAPARTAAGGVRLFLAGDVMTGRGVDRILPYSVDPRLYEPYVRHAEAYVNLAERANGPIPAPVDFGYVWGEALAVLDTCAPQARIVNLETAVTDRGEPWPRKGIHYRMHPGNVPCLTAARIDCCTLANNHVLDWGRTGLQDTLAALHGAGIATAGAGAGLDEAAAPAILESEAGRVLVFSCAHRDSGVPAAWAAGEDRPGVHLLSGWTARELDRLGERIAAVRRPGDVVVVSLHWGGNWGYEVPREHRRFAQGLIEHAGVHVVHGHSSHHPKAVEIHRGQPILYGCGDLLNDYEGIEGHEAYRPGIAPLYFADLDAGGGPLRRLELVPMRIARMRLHHAREEDHRWLAATLARECARFDTAARATARGTIVIEPGPRR